MELPNPQDIHVKVSVAKDFSIRGQDYFEDRYNSVLYPFKAGHAITLPPDVARHIFGCVFGQSSLTDMFNHFAKRQGWNTPEMSKLTERVDSKGRQMTVAQVLWSKLKFDSVVMQMVEVPLKELAKDADKAA